MIAIVLSACLISDPAVCRDYKIPLNAGYSSSACMMHAPPHFAKWAKSHPGWVIKSWRCRPVSEDEI